jgi:hypothetical protein
MGYSTTLFAVDVDELRSAVGSNDRKLVARVMKAEKLKPAVKKKADAASGPRVKVSKNSELFLDGQPVSLDELHAALRKSKWKGAELYLYHESGRKTGRWKTPGSFEQALTLPRHIAGVMYCNDEADLLRGWQNDAEISDEQALVELIAGKFTRRECAPQYAYALERVCRTLGSRLANIPGKGQLRALKLDTPLSAPRLPAPLPKYDDFPYVSYLTAAEVQHEIERLGSMNLSFPADADIEAARKTLLKCMKTAAKQEVGIVAFYY